MVYLVEVVVLLRLEEVEGLPLLFTGSSQQVVEDMVVPTEHSNISMEARQRLQGHGESSGQ